MEIIIVLALLGAAYFAYTKLKEGGSALEKTDQSAGAPDLFKMKKGWLVDFFDNFILKGFPIEGHNML
ncbi:MAG: hypothetical protein ACE5FU_10160, partial [Nitrospinota bacterium]